jgi:OOP family OmpA-OmpF porin
VNANLKFFTLGVYYFLWWIGTISAFCQHHDTINIVPNPGFEHILQPPKSWFTNGADFDRAVKYWTSASDASPDLYHPKIDIPPRWRGLGFGKISPRRGNSMAGITIYGCEGGKPHCREYIQVQLKEPLVPGQRYYVELYVRRLDKSLEAGNIGMYFSKDHVFVPGDPLLDVSPQVNFDKVIHGHNFWTKLSDDFVALDDAAYLVIGNFFPDSATKTKRKSRDHYGYAYYYIDDITVKKIPPILPIPVRDDDIRYIHFEKGDTIKLRNIYFESDQFDLHPIASQELDKLYYLMQKYPKMIIEISGHTDAQGDSIYNQKLSTKRAQAVVEYLVDKGIPSFRLHFKGHGSTFPVADNQSPSGRRLNRRVELVVLEK